MSQTTSLDTGVTDSVTALIGHTPLLRLRRFEHEVCTGVELYAKAEWQNPGGSVKDRAAIRMVLEGERAGLLTAGKTILDATSGNTGIAYAMIGAARGYPVTLCMPENVTPERKRILRAYGAEIVFTNPLEGSDGAIRAVRAMYESDPDRYFYPDQYSNPSNPRAHYLTTAPELWEQTGGKLTHFVAGLGTTGTVMGTGRRLKELNPAIQIVAVEPAEPMHGLEGLKHLGSSIIPPIYDPALHDRKLSITTDAGWDMTDRLLKDEGLAVGHSSGAALAGAYQVARELSEQGEKGRVVAVFCDRADRYFEPGRPAPRFPYR